MYKLGTLKSIEDDVLHIQLREDFIVVDQDEESTLLEATTCYKGKGLYQVLIEELVEVYVQIKDKDQSLFTQEAPVKIDQANVVEEFNQNQKTNLIKAAVKQIEFYFSN